jgi:heavy metal translocating P-type ATPase
MVTLGRWLEATAKLKTTESIESLAKLLPHSARLVGSGAETIVALRDVAVGDRVRVLPGERIPFDGSIVRGSAAVDEQFVTGESSPVVKESADRVFAGTTNLDGALVVEVTATTRNGTVSRLIELVRQACRSKGRYERLADRVATWFTPAVMLLALATFTWHAWSHGVHRGVLSGLAVLLIACPCALGLATPMAVWSALGRAAQSQVIFRNGDALEQLAAIQAIRLDKTGTLTTGAPTVAEFTTDDDMDRQQALAQITWLASASSHSLAVAVREFAAQSVPFTTLDKTTHHESVGQPVDSRDHVRTLAGRGVVGHKSHNGSSVYLGSLKLMQEAGLDCSRLLTGVIQDALRAGNPLVCAGWDGKVRGVFVLREQLRDEAHEAVLQLRAAGLDVRVLTGDHDGRGAAIERALGIPVEAELLPEAKVAAVECAHRQFGPVAMVGDGINDAPAIARSDVGIAMGCGADVTRDSAAVCLLGNDLIRLPWAIRLARRTLWVIRRNLFWAFAYNLVGIGMACTGRLNPVLAALAMVLSSACVLTSSLRLNADAHEGEFRTQSGTASMRKTPDSTRLAEATLASAVGCK